VSVLCAVQEDLQSYAWSFDMDLENDSTSFNREQRLVAGSTSSSASSSSTSPTPSPETMGSPVVGERVDSPYLPTRSRSGGDPLKKQAGLGRRGLVRALSSPDLKKGLLMMGESDELERTKSSQWASRKEKVLKASPKYRQDLFHYARYLLQDLVQRRAKQKGLTQTGS
jgi:hypothetical protein